MAARLKEAQPASVLDLATDREFSHADFGMRSRTRALSQPISIRERLRTRSPNSAIVKMLNGGKPMSML